MKNRPKHCIKTLAMLLGIAAVLLGSSAVVGEAMFARLVQAVRAAPASAPPAQAVQAAPQAPQPKNSSRAGAPGLPDVFVDMGGYVFAQWYYDRGTARGQPWRQALRQADGANL